MARHFVRLTSDGIVNQDLEIDGPSADLAPVPEGMIEITGHRQWRGLGVFTRQRTRYTGRGDFTDSTSS